MKQPARKGENVHSTEGGERRKRALVTGAAKRVGAAIAEALAFSGMDVAVHYHHSEQAAFETCQRIQDRDGHAIALAADLSHAQQCRGLVDQTVEKLGGLDLLVCSAANFEPIAFDNIDESAWARSMSLNLESAFWLSQHASSHLRQAKGSIVFVTCHSTHTPFRNYLPYVVSKGALKQLMRVLAVELAPEIRVNAVAPGAVLPPANMGAEQVQKLADKIALGHIGSAQDIADAVLYLAQARFVTGQQLLVDGGQSFYA